MPVQKKSRMQIPPRLKKAVNYESNPISFGKPKETGLCLKRKVLCPCCLLPLVAAKFTLFGTPLCGIPQPFACRSSSPKIFDFRGPLIYPLGGD